LEEGQDQSYSFLSVREVDNKFILVAYFYRNAHNDPHPFKELIPYFATFSPLPSKKRIFSQN
jgi:hypothetical protein